MKDYNINKGSIYYHGDNKERILKEAKRLDRKPSKVVNMCIDQYFELERIINANRQLTGDKLLKAIRDGIGR